VESGKGEELPRAVKKGRIWNSGTQEGRGRVSVILGGGAGNKKAVRPEWGSGLVSVD